MSILCHWAWSTGTSSAEPTCYFPDGRVASTYQPCNSTVDGDASVCCEVSTSVCGSQGLCYGSDGYLYRGGCTDRKWKSAGCPTLCLDGMKLFVKFTKTQSSRFHGADFLFKLQWTGLLSLCHVQVALNFVIFAAVLTGERIAVAVESFSLIKM